ncbi:hypothetical protein EDD22DRAFT_898485 [Suillus occidentalis]|nr:hypothetical protein EDD22DRAFT_898485 [Suillus occidentalis]
MIALDCEFKMDIPISHTLSMRNLRTHRMRIHFRTYRTSASARRNLQRWMSLIWSQVRPLSCKQRRASREDHQKTVVCLYSLTNPACESLLRPTAISLHRQVSISRCTNQDTDKLRNSQSFNGVELYRKGYRVALGGETCQQLARSEIILPIHTLIPSSAVPWAYQAMTGKVADKYNLPPPPGLLMFPATGTDEDDKHEDACYQDDGEGVS